MIYKAALQELIPRPDLSGLRLRLLLRPLRFLLVRLATIAVVSLLIVFAVHLSMSVLVTRQVMPDASLSLGHYVDRALLHTDIFLGNLRNGHLGTVQEIGGRYRLVSRILEFSFKSSIGLLLPALFLSTTLGLAIGMAAALTRRPGRRMLLILISFLGVAAPSFLIAVALQTLVIRYSQHFDTRLLSVGGFAWDWEHMVLPVLVLMARPTAYVARATYVGMVEVMRQDYIRTAYAKGLSQPRTVLTHALRNLAVPLLTAVGVSLRFSLSALPIVEYIFAWPGMGRRLLESIQDPEPLLVIPIALVLSLIIQLVSMFLEASYRFIDPRIASRTAEAL